MHSNGRAGRNIEERSEGVTGHNEQGVGHSMETRVKAVETETGKHNLSTHSWSELSVILADGEQWRMI